MNWPFLNSASLGSCSGLYVLASSASSNLVVAGGSTAFGTDCGGGEGEGEGEGEGAGAGEAGGGGKGGTLVSPGQQARERAAV